MPAILGINAYHGDSSACLLVDDTIVGAVEEERFKRTKHYAGLPLMSVQWCLDQAGLRLSDVDQTAVNRNPNAHVFRKLVHLVRNATGPSFLGSRTRNRKTVLAIKDALAQGLGTDVPKARLHFVEHHAAHVASAYYGSSFDDALVMSIDGF